MQLGPRQGGEPPALHRGPELVVVAVGLVQIDLGTDTPVVRAGDAILVTKVAVRAPRSRCRSARGPAPHVAYFSATADGQLRCVSCGRTHAPSGAAIESLTRFEGASNPVDQAVLFGLRCGVRGVYVAAYSPTTTAEEAAVITALAPRP